MRNVRTRFCPSPTGMVHVGLADGAVQLGARAAHGRHLRLPHRGHGRHRDSEESYRHLLDCLRWLGLDWDEGPRSGPARSLQAERAGRDLHRGRRQAARGRARLRVLLHQRGGRRAGWPPGRTEARLRQRRPVPHRRAEGGVPRRGPLPGAAPEDARRGPRLDRPGARRSALRGRLRARLRARPGPRAAVPLRQPGGRRPDGDHRRAPRRGPAALDTAPAGALRRAHRHRRRLGHPRFGHLP